MEVTNITTELVKLALDASQLRLNAISNNIANVNTMNYKPIKVSFEKQLEPYKKALLNKNNDVANEKILQEVKPSVEQLKIDGDINVDRDSNVKLDMELVELSKNVLHYKALLQANSKRGALMKMAVRGEVI